MKDVINVDDLLIQIHFKENSIPSIHARQMTEESKQQLHSLLISKLPEKKMTTVGLVVDPHDLSKGPVGNIPIQNGYNTAIDDMRKSIDEMFGVKG